MFGQLAGRQEIRRHDVGVLTNAKRAADEYQIASPFFGTAIGASSSPSYTLASNSAGATSYSAASL